MRLKLLYRTINKSCPAALYLLLCFLLFCGSSAAEIVDRVVAVVNDDVITLSELDEEIEQVSAAQLRSGQFNPATISDELRERALDNLIDLRLIEQKANEYRITASEEEIDRAYEMQRQKMSLSPAAFKMEMEKSGLTEESFRDRLRANILQQKVVSLDVHAKVVITEEMIEEYYQKEYTTNVDEGSYYLLQMGFIWEEGTDPEGTEANKAAARQRAERIRKLALDGQNFKSLAQKLSELPSADDGGDIGVISLDDMAQSMKNAIENLQPDEISDIIETPTAFQFFKVLSGGDEETAQSVPLDSVREEIHRKIGEQKLKESFAAWVQELKNKAYIQKL